MIEFDEREYLRRYDEQEYLRRYEDVAAAVQSGDFASGWDHFVQHGEGEGRWPVLQRMEKIFHGLDVDAEGLEIGGGYNPLLDAANVRLADHLDQEGLREKYAAQGVDVSRIRPVDYVWTGQPLPELIRETFDWVAASHVIEHIPDVIGFLQGCEKILKPGGTLTLVVPDRRFTFDYYRPPSSLSAIIDAHLERRVKPSIGAITEQYRYHCATSHGFTWDKRIDEKPTLYGDASAPKLAENAAGQYVDGHVWVFTPNHFRVLMLDLFELGYTRLRERAFFPTVGFEFYVQLALDGPGPDQSWQDLVIAAVQDAASRD
jgi:SAM-dependent methyltransferase